MTKKILFALLFATRITRLVAWLNRDKVTILCYHSVTRARKDKSKDPHKLLLPVDSFVQQLDYLKAHYRIISLEQFVKARRDNSRLPSGAAILTFEDGQRNFLTVAAPPILERGLPVTSFIITGDGYTQENSSRNGDWAREDDNEHLSWDDIRRLSRLGVKFGSHTNSHSPLTDIPAVEARNELQKSLYTLTSRLGAQHFPVSYPHGKTTEGINRLSQALGYSCAVTTKLGLNGHDQDLFDLRRTVIASDDDLPTFAARLSGLTYWYSRIAGFLGFRTEDPNSALLHCDQALAEDCGLNET
jgi:peptidoglycan/xylan/chitin deacetylase (PgdA/CDA1 family)